MASRQERCIDCGVLLMVPAEVNVFECGVCHGITQIRPSIAPWTQAYNSFHSFTGRFRGFLNTIRSTSSVNTNSAGYYGPNSFGLYPHPHSLRPSFHVYGSKRAVLCGIRYHGKSYKLKGSINDAKCMKYFLIKHYGFPSDSILMLTDDMEERDQLRIPTRYNILMAMRWLLQNTQSGDSLVFHFSGHGTQQISMDGNEIDGLDEAICPVDYEEQGKILDDEINTAIVRPLPRGAKLHAIVDACHSGTVLDLSFVCKMNREGYYSWEDQRSPKANKGTSGGLAVSISACEDSQTSIDTSALSGTEATGVLTYSFIQTVQNEPGLSYGRLLSAMRSTIRGTKTGLVPLNGPIASMFNRLLGMELRQVMLYLFHTDYYNFYMRRFILESLTMVYEVGIINGLDLDLQEPQLSSSEVFDVYNSPFVL